MSKYLIWLYIKVMGLVLGVAICYGWMFPALMSADDWVLVALGLFGMLVSAPFVFGFGVMIYNEVEFVYKKFKESKK